MAETDLATQLQNKGWHYLGEFESPPRLEVQHTCAEDGLDAVVDGAEKGAWLLVQRGKTSELFRYSGFELSVPASSGVKSAREIELNRAGWTFFYNQTRLMGPGGYSVAALRTPENVKQQYLDEGWPEVHVDEQTFRRDGKPLGGNTDFAVYVRVPGARAVPQSAPPAT